MCGICGFYQLEEEADQTVLQRMNDRIIHRGPDDDGYYSMGKKVALAARRLSIIDLVTGHQPLSSGSGQCWITFNGEVYNFKELKEELKGKGHRFKTQTDTEVVVNLYEEYGPDFVRKLRGMFAIGIYDRRNDTLILARDHVGIKPLYYCLKPENKNIVFGSEIKSILEYPRISRELDYTAIDFLLTLEYIPAPYSIFKDIRKLPAGHILIYKGGEITVNQYWEVNRKPSSGDFFQLKETFLNLFDRCVKMRMISDVPLGAFLSGGIDSSAIVASMSAQSTEPIKTFSIGFEEKSYSELKYSSLVADRFHTSHYTKNLSPDINDLVLHLADYFDEPLGDFSNFPTFLVSQTAREKVTVVLSGDGGDEVFGGYEHYIAQKVARFMDIPLLRPLHAVLSKMTRLFPPSELKKGFVNRIKRFSEGLANNCRNRHFRWMIFLSEYQKAKLYSPEFARSDFTNQLPDRLPFSSYFDHSRQFQGINRDLYLDFKTYLADNILVKVDRASMATSLEARVPFLDYKMVEFAFSLPPEYKVRGKTTKWFLKNALKGILPDNIIHRRKEGFSIPIKNWLKKELKDLMMEYLSRKRVTDMGLFNYEYTEKMISEHLGGKQNHSHRLWSLILLNIWKEKFLDRKN